MLCVSRWHACLVCMSLNSTSWRIVLWICRWWTSWRCYRQYKQPSGCSGWSAVIQGCVQRQCAQLVRRTQLCWICDDCWPGQALKAVSEAWQLLYGARSGCTTACYMSHAFNKKSRVPLEWHRFHWLGECCSARRTCGLQIFCAWIQRRAQYFPGCGRHAGSASVYWAQTRRIYH